MQSQQLLNVQDVRTTSKVHKKNPVRRYSTTINSIFKVLESLEKMAKPPTFPPFELKYATLGKYGKGWSRFL